MKLSALTPCILCKGPVTPLWYCLRMSMAVLNERNTRSVLGTAEILGGLRNRGALGIAEVMAAGANDAVTIGMDKDPELMTQVFICNNCYLMKPSTLAEIMEAATREILILEEFDSIVHEGGPRED